MTTRLQAIAGDDAEVVFYATVGLGLSTAATLALVIDVQLKWAMIGGGIVFVALLAALFHPKTARISAVLGTMMGVLYYGAMAGTIAWSHGTIWGLVGAAAGGAIGGVLAGFAYRNFLRAMFRRED